MRTIQRYTTGFAACLAAVLLALLLLAILAIGLGSAAVETSSPIASALLAPLRSYLFRNALRNTGIVLAVALPLTYLLALAAVTLMVQNSRSRGVMSWLLLLPLAMPLALAMPAWRQVFAASPALAGGVLPALAAVSVIQAWRILPFATLFLLLARPVGQQRIAMAMTLCFGAYAVVCDVTVPLLLTGGEPYNATHLLASWLYQTAVAGAMPGQAAVMAIPLMVAAGGLAWGFLQYAARLNTAIQERYTLLQPAVAAASRRRQRPVRERRPRRGFVTSAEHTPQAMGGVLLASPVIIVLLLPLSVPLVMTGDMMLWPAALSQLFGRLDYGHWLANTALLAGLTALVTVLVAIPVGQRLAAWRSPWSTRLTGAGGVLGLTALAVAFVPLAWLQTRQAVGDGRWVLALIYGAIGITVGVWLVALVSRGAVRVPRSVQTSWLVLLSYLLVTNEMGAALALSDGMSRTQSLNSGLITRLAFDVSMAQPVIGLAILMPVVLLLFFYWWLVRGAIAPLVELGEEGGDTR